MAVSRPTYASREAIKEALDVKLTARADRQVDRAIESASRAVEALCHRVFYPRVETRSFDWPGRQNPTPWRLWLNQHELISLTSLTAGGTTIATGDVELYPDGGPPYTRIEIDLSSSAAFEAGDTRQKAIVVTGLFGYRDDSEPAGTLTAAVSTTTATTIAVSDSSAVGVGDLVKVDSERMLVTSKAMADTAVNIDAADSLTANANDVSITLSTLTAAPTAGETILIDSERMLVVDVAGSVLTVKRAWDGSVLAAHASSADIYAPRTLTVTRGAVGSIAATHSTSTAVSRWLPPELVRELAEAEAVNTVLQRPAGYARVVGGGENEREASGRGIRQVRADCRAAHGRKARSSAI